MIRLEKVCISCNKNAKIEVNFYFVMVITEKNERCKYLVELFDGVMYC